jgi:hypothetical protein
VGPRQGTFRVILTALNRSLAGALVVLPIAVAAACTSSSKGSGGDGTSSSGGAAGDGGFTPLPASPTTWTMTATVPASNEIFECQYIAMPQAAGWVVGGDSEFTVGSHHLLVYATDLTSIPAGESGVGDCYEGTEAGVANYMNHIRGVVYGAQVPTFSTTMPPGVGIPYAAGAVLLFQVHYLNATASDFQAVADVHLAVATSGITTNAGVLFFYDPYIDVPAGAKATASLRCPIPQSITLLGATSHYHSRGVGFQAYVDPPSGPPATTPFYTSDNWVSLAIMTTSTQVPAGSYVRYYCDYDNTLGNEEYVQGPSAANNEMCMFIGTYYPAMPLDDEDCYGGDTFGTGTATCLETVDCLAACPPEDAGVSFADGSIDLSSEPTLSACIQKCNVASCPNAGAAVASYVECTESYCASACAGSTTSSPSNACMSCVAAHCLTPYEACSGLAPCDP